jgi:hypothetical protein
VKHITVGFIGDCEEDGGLGLVRLGERELAISDTRAWFFGVMAILSNATNNRLKSGRTNSFPRYRSPGHHVEVGSSAEILVGRSVTRWLRLNGYPRT